MTGLERFALYNLAASLMAGLVAWAAVMVALKMLRARAAFLYASFLALPLLKSLFILLGLGLVLPWTGLSVWERQAAPVRLVLPFVLLWFGVALIVYQWLVKQARADLLLHASQPEPADDQRLRAALARLIQAYQQAGCCEAGETVCCLSDHIPPNPRLLVSNRLRSPTALVEGGLPMIVFPRGLIRCLDDDELALALAHELNHFALRRPGGWSAGNLRPLALVSPVALLLADSLHKEEEKACDDLAVRILGMPETYAGMLLKSYTFAHQGTGQRTRLPVLPQLLGYKPFLSERIERLVNPSPLKSRWFQSRLVTWPFWVLLLYLLFFARFGS